MWDDSTRLAVREPPTDGLHDIQVVQHIVQTAIVWQAVEKRPNGVFSGHGSLKSRMLGSSIRPRIHPAKFLVSGFDVRSAG
jgi:hypothetical protein